LIATPQLSRRAALTMMVAATVPRRAHAAGDAIDVRAHGARGDRSTDDAPAFTRAFSACMQAGVPLYIPAGRYRLAAPLAWDVRPQRKTGIGVFGDGAQMTMLDFTAPAAGPHLLLHCSGDPADSFYSRLHDFGIQGTGAGPVLQIGQDNFSDAHNACSLERIVINANGGGAALRLNGVYGAHVDVVANASGAASGIAMQLRQSQFCAFYGAQGNAAIGTLMADGYNTGNVFTAIDYEVLGTAIRIAGDKCAHNSWIGGTIAHAQWGFDCSAGNGNQASNINQAIPSERLIRNAAGFRFDLPSMLPVATPKLPQSGLTTINNTGRPVQVGLIGGEVAAVSINGVVIGRRSNIVVRLRSGDRLAIVYSHAPEWAWLPD
jgi:hypothetical protein